MTIYQHPTLTTARLILRPFTEADSEPLHHILSQKGVLRYFPKPDPPTPEQVQAMIAGLLNHWDKHGYGLWAVESQETGALMGRSGMQYLPDSDEVEVDFILGKEFWRQGFATEAGQASLRYGFELLEVTQIIGIVHLENKASQRLLEKIGLRDAVQTRYFGMDCYRYVINRSAF